MKIHILKPHKDFDGFLWPVLEGWANDGVLERNTVKINQERTMLEPAEDFWETLPDTDAILLSIRGGQAEDKRVIQRATDLFDRHKLWGKVVFHDYNHNKDLLYPGLAKKCRKVLIAKRYKWLKVKDWPNTEWLIRTCMMDWVLRHNRPLPWKMWKDIPLICAYRHSVVPGQRHRAPWMRALGKNIPEAQTRVIRDPSDQSHPVLRRICGGRYVASYLEKMSRSRVGVYLMGGNDLGNQFWEIVGLECALLAMHQTLHPTPEEDWQEFEHFPDPFIEGEDFVYFRSEEELVGLAKELIDDPDRCESMALSARKKLEPYRSGPRSRYIMKLLKECA